MDIVQPCYLPFLSITLHSSFLQQLEGFLHGTFDGLLVHVQVHSELVEFPYFLYVNSTKKYGIETIIQSCTIYESKMEDENIKIIAEMLY